MEPVRIGLQQKTVLVPVEPVPLPLYQPTAGYSLSAMAERDGVTFFTTALVDLTGRLDFDLFARCSEELGIELSPRQLLFDRPVFAGLVTKTGDTLRNHRLEVLPAGQFEAFHEWLRNMAVYLRDVDYFRRFAWGKVQAPEHYDAPERGSHWLPYVQVATNRGCFTMTAGESGCSSRANFSQDVATEITEFARRLRGGITDLYGVQLS